MKTQLDTGVLATKGRVVFSDGYRAEISVGFAPKPEMNVYMDGRFVQALQLSHGDEVVITLERVQRSSENQWP